MHAFDAGLGYHAALNVFGSEYNRFGHVGNTWLISILVEVVPFAFL